MDDLTGKSIGRYQVLSLLGEGGMATVYLARDTVLDCDVAVKFIRIDDLPPSSARTTLARFAREAQATARLSHLHIVDIKDFGEYAGMPYLVMRYIPGGTLKDQMRRRAKPYSPAEAARLLAPIARALEYAHEKNIIHRDVKPGNILLTESNQAVLSDFGIAKVFGEGAQATLTGTGVGLGTASYMAPEQWRGKSEPASDQYALGVVLYEMVTGKMPYQADTPGEVFYKVISEPLPPPRQFAPGLPVEAERVILRALEKDPRQRFANMGAFAQALERMAGAIEPIVAHGSAPQPAPVHHLEVTTDEGSTAVKPSTPPRGESPGRGDRPKPAPWRLTQWLLAGGGGLALLLACLGVVWLGSRVLLPGLFATRTPAPPTATQTSTAAPPTATHTMLSPTRTFTPAFTATLTLTTSPALTSSPKDSDSIVSPKDGMTLLYVSAGEFMMGSADADKGAVDNEKPQHSVTLDAFWIDKTEVTNAMYARCVAAGACAAPNRMNSNRRSSYYGDSSFANYPVIYVNWNQAKAYCEWAGRRLPTEAEWEKAARGTDGRIYPWGNIFPDSILLNFGENIRDTTEVGSYPRGVSPYGALDMAGNVWEWVADWYGATYYKDSPSKNPQGPSSGQDRVLRGGSWGDDTRSVRAADRISHNPGFVGSYIGFRCAR
ncbi:MAG TPA: bifunctional serine/threonine-protein kinase/formylglycine-generating enzyme family protein [Anaerolineaceae bacterium]